jgi:hypothetical protein
MAYQHTQAWRPGRNLRTLKVTWSIKGYHYYHTRPHVNVRLLLEAEPHNAYDRSAIAVYVPPLDQIPAEQQGLITDGWPPYRVRQQAGKQVGHVPANLCQFFSKLQERNICTIDSIKCMFTGVVGPTNHPNPRQRFHRNHPYRRDTVGGGAELEAVYFVTYNKDRLRAVDQLLVELIPVEDREKFAL